jgi:hypothetical protein
MSVSTLLLEHLKLPVAAIPYTIHHRLRDLFPQQAIVEMNDCEFGLERFAAAGHCALEPHPDVCSPQVHTWEHGRLHSGTPIGWFRVVWEGHSLQAVLATWPGIYGSDCRQWVIAPSVETGRAFASAVLAWASEVHGEVLVYSGGGWHRDSDLFDSIRGATLDSLFLAGDLRRELQEDMDTFFRERETYEHYRVPWKRGILFVGPPGNGKTHAVKALINHLRQPCLYVKSFESRFDTEQSGIRAVFERARATTPCLLVFEDLDALISNRNRAYFLNELDGFAANTGIVTLATTNHPERLDPAILDRPSRFDRKYHFEPPEVSERHTYLHWWNEKLNPMMRLTPLALRQVAEGTESFSYAYLKELVLSSMMLWISQGPGRPMGPLMLAQAGSLRSQMSSMNEVQELHDAGEGDPGADGEE